MNKEYTITLTSSELLALAGRLESLMSTVNEGADVWLAPNGISEAADNEFAEDVCFLASDDVDVKHLNSVVLKLNSVL